MVGGVYGWFEYAGIYGVTFRNRFLSLSLFFSGFVCCLREKEELITVVIVIPRYL